MNRLVAQWLSKAEADLRSARVESAVEREPNHDAVCFFGQQCVEKTMKAVLIASNADAPKTHDLSRLSSLVTAVLPAWSWDEEELERLTRGAVEFRYPEINATPEESKAALDVSTRLHGALLALLPPDDP